MAAMEFAGEMARIQRGLAQCHDMVLRRGTVLEALDLRAGERVLEIGCGGGFYAYEVAQMVGRAGRVCAIDISDDQVAAAGERCAEFDWVECRTASAVDLPYGEGDFDAAYCVQVLEYVPEVDAALGEIHRVLRPGGRLVNLATNWGSVVWHSGDPERMERVLAAWKEHAPYPDLPAGLLARIARTGMQPLGQTPAPVLNTSYNENSFSYWLAKMITAFTVGRKTVAADEAEAWLREFADLDTKGGYFFCSAPIVTLAVKIP